MTIGIKSWIRFAPHVSTLGSASRAPGSSAPCTRAPPAWRAHASAAVAASTPESARRPRERLGAERAFASAEELVAGADIDVVHICTPNHLHLPLAEAALAAGKHVVCEKPLALDGGGARRLVDAAAARGSAGGRAIRLPLLPDGARGA